jgi:hypothetical protein
MNETQVLAYVKAAATALALPLDDEQALRVAAHFARSAAMAAQLEREAAPGEADEPAQVYVPKPFPAREERA